MKTLLVIFLMLTIPAAAAYADVCVKQKSHTDGYYYGGTTTPPEDDESEIWIGAGKMAVHGENTAVIIDQADSLMIFVNHTDSTFAEIALPMDWSQVVDEALLGRLSMFKRQGEIVATGETKKIGDWECAAYKLVTWIPYMDIKYDEREITTWVATNAPIDMAAYTEMMVELGKLRNFSDELIEETKKMEGLPVSSDGVIYQKGFSVNTTDELIEMFEDDAPDGTYAVPEGYTKKDQLTIQDLRS
jgi:hypothetical protein